jgi:hypothetical protein
MAVSVFTLEGTNKGIIAKQPYDGYFVVET